MEKRKSLRLKTHDYATPGAYFITIHCKPGVAPFWDWAKGDGRTAALSRMGEFALRELKQIPKTTPGAVLDEIAVLPNHIHLILILEPRISTDIPTLIGNYKRRLTRYFGAPLWQRSYYDRIVRDQRELEEIRQYIRDNPFKEYLRREQQWGKMPRKD